MTNALVAYDPQTFETMQRVAKAMMASGFFSDVNDIAQAYVKIQAGAELGIPPFAALTGINIQGGKPTLGANLIATLIDRHPSYSYRVRVLTDAECSIEFFQNGESVGMSSFTMKDAQTAKVWSKKQGGFIPLTQHNQNWQSYPRNMLFARAMTNGARWYAAAVFGGAPVYTPEEMGDESYLPEISDSVPESSAHVVQSEPAPVDDVEDGEYTDYPNEDWPHFGDGDPVPPSAMDAYLAFVAERGDAPKALQHLRNWYKKRQAEEATPAQPALVEAKAEQGNGAYEE